MDAETRFHENISLAYAVVHKHYYKTPRSDLKDVLQVAMIGLWKACLSYDESKSTAFSTYASRCIYNEVGQYLRPLRRKKDILIISFDDPIGCPDDNLTVGDTIYKEEDNYSLIETLSMFEALDEEEKEIVRLRLDGLNQIEISTHLGCSQSWVSRRMKAIKSKLTG